MAHKSTCRSGRLNPCWIGMVLIIGACGPSDMTQGARENAKQQSNAGAPSAPELVLGVKKRSPASSSARRSATDIDNSGVLLRAGRSVLLLRRNLTSTGPSKYGFTPTQPCIQSGVFKRGMRMVVRFEILDTKTGKRVTDRDGANIKLLLPHGEEIPGRWTIRGSAAAMPDSAWMWDTTWDIPPDYPVGSLDYRIAITATDGRAATFTPPIQKAKTADTRVRIID